MVRVNVRPSKLSNRPVHEPAATQVFSPQVELERMVSCCLLGEDQFYVNGQDAQARIFELAQSVDLVAVATLAIKARTELGLRHAPLWLLIALANRKEPHCSPLIQKAAVKVLRTPKDAMDLIALYWKDGRKPLPWSFKRALTAGFARWSDFQLQRYATLGRDKKTSVRLLDLMRLVHPNIRHSLNKALPVDIELPRKTLFRDIAKDTVTAPETWESLLPKAEGDEQKRAVWEKLLTEGKLGALATVRNLRNMASVNVRDDLIRIQLGAIRATDVWPWQALAAAKVAPQFSEELEEIMIRSSGQFPSIPGRTMMLVDVSGSMNDKLSEKGTILRYEAAAGVAVIMREACEASAVVTFSNATVALSNDLRGIALANAIANSQAHQGTYLGQSVKGILDSKVAIDRLVVLTDEQAQYGMPKCPFPVFIVNLASYQRGVDIEGEVTRINGWSGGVVRFLAKQTGVGGLLTYEPSDEEEAE